MWAPADLVEQVKWAQRSSPALKDSWHRFCDQTMGGIRDPSKHSPAQLQQFLGMIGRLPGSAAAPAPMGPGGPVPTMAPAQPPMGAMMPQMGAMPSMPSMRPQVPQAVDPQAAALGQATMAPMGAWPMSGAYPPLPHPAQAAQMAQTLAYQTSMGLGVPFPAMGQPMAQMPQQGFVQQGMVPAVAAVPAQMPSASPAVAPLPDWGAQPCANGGGGDPAALHAQLVQQVKKLQRSSDAMQAAWHDLCDAERGGVRDPAMHDLEFMQRFLWGQASASAGAAGTNGDGALGPLLPGGSQDPQHADLVAQVKRAQRAGWKEQWSAHCDQEAGGMRDPTRHSTASLKRFLEGRARLSPGQEAAEPPAGGNKASDMELVERVKSAQRASPERKDLWRKHCDARGSGTYDPMRHDNSFLQAFLDEHGITQEALPVPAKGAPGAPSTRGGPVKPAAEVEPLVQRVKHAKRASQELFRAWHHMCNVEGNGVRDPARHDAAFLLRFLEGVGQHPGAMPAAGQ